jgi:bacterioferritin
MPELNRDRVVELLNRILEAELAGVVRYTHYSFLVYPEFAANRHTWL